VEPVGEPDQGRGVGDGQVHGVAAVQERMIARVLVRMAEQDA